MTDRLGKLEHLIDLLRGPDGCPWDREQELSDLRAYVLEEAHELAAAIDRAEPEQIQEELGDLLFQVVFVSRLLPQPGAGTALTATIEAAHQKMVARHPHVFGDESAPDSAAVRRAWEERKVAATGGSALAGVPETLPGLLGAQRLSQKAAGVGFDWRGPSQVMHKIEEELAEVAAALEADQPPEIAEEEIGDLLFATANLARKLGLDPEVAMQRANRKFKHRFQAMEAKVGDGNKLSELAPDELEALWRSAKKS